MLTPQDEQLFSANTQGLLGRPATQDELNWLNSLPSNVDHSTAIQQYLQGAQQLISRIQTEGQAYGNEISIEDATAIFNKTYKAGDQYVHDNFMSLVRPQLERLATKKEEEAFKNPAISDDHTSNAARVVKETLGRDASPDELAFYSKALAQGDSPFELSQFIRTTPEFLENQSKQQKAAFEAEGQQARSALNAQLLKDEEETFKRALPNIISQFQRAGRLGSSGLENALARERSRMAQERQSYLANQAFAEQAALQGYRRDDFVNARAQAFNQYLRQNEPRYQQQLSYGQIPFQTFQRNLGYGDMRQQRIHEAQDYAQEKSDFDRYLRESRKSSRESALWGLGGSILGAGIQGLTAGYGRK